MYNQTPAQYRLSIGNTIHLADELVIDHSQHALACACQCAYNPARTDPPKTQS
jgi:hypothetical protein